ncbi:metal dependent phosphoesterase [Legionella beliardensis]|uniref:Metal dependent phosphoesterase n=1 Tax=Legionella beliardensis TaxID=91822 RepID=A0A378I1C5_9GAMM|nr:PHP domain-containing protein [Legionella beliardensis]STX28783.1 metal dependent phosphoesterase [Legionella beliardensis]
MIDLHCHSHFSDGVLSPNELIMKAAAANLKFLALTDHDTTAGIEDLLRTNNQHSVTLITGIELSTRWKKYDIHIIGLGIDITHPFLIELITKQNDRRINRAKRIAEQLTHIGIHDAFNKACILAGHDRIGRPHFAQLCINEGKARDMQSAFKQFLRRGKCAYIETSWISVDEAVTGITKAGGQAVLAHPLKYQLTQTKLNELIKEFKSVGGEGLEVVSGAVTTDQKNLVAGLCQRYELLASSGSDYHGETLSRISLGRQAQLPLNCMPIWHKWNI